MEGIRDRLGMMPGAHFDRVRRPAAGRLEGADPVPPRLDRLSPEEHGCIRASALRCPRVGCRELSWMMTDGEHRCRPTGPHQGWHTDVRCVWVAGRHRFRRAIANAFCRPIRDRGPWAERQEA